MQGIIAFVAGFIFAILMLVPVVFIAYRLLIYERTILPFDVDINTEKAIKELDLLSERMDRLAQKALDFNGIVGRCKNGSHN